MVFQLITTSLLLVVFLGQVVAEWQSWPKYLYELQQRRYTLLCAHFEGQRQAALANLTSAMVVLREQSYPKLSEAEERHAFYRRLWEGPPFFCHEHLNLWQPELLLQNQRSHPGNWPNWRYVLRFGDHSRGLLDLVTMTGSLHEGDQGVGMLDWIMDVEAAWQD